MRVWLVIALTVSLGYGCRTPELGGLQVDVNYSISTPGGGCIRVRAAPDKAGQFVGGSRGLAFAALPVVEGVADLPLAGQARTGRTAVAINQVNGWPQSVEILCTLHHDDACAEPPVAARATHARFPAGVVELSELELIDSTVR